MSVSANRIPLRRDMRWGDERQSNSFGVLDHPEVSNLIGFAFDPEFDLVAWLDAVTAPIAASTAQQSRRFAAR